MIAGWASRLNSIHIEIKFQCLRFVLSLLKLITSQKPTPRSLNLSAGYGPHLSERVDLDGIFRFNGFYLVQDSLIAKFVTVLVNFLTYLILYRTSFLRHMFEMVN